VSERSSRIPWTWVRLLIGLALLAWLIHAKAIDLAALSALITRWPISLAAIAIFIFDLTLMALRLCLLLRPHGMRLPYTTSLQLTLVGSFFSLFLPGRAGGDFARIFYASKANATHQTEVVSVLIFDRALGLFSLLVLPLLFAPLFPSLLHDAVLRMLVLACACLAGGMLAAFALSALLAPVLARMARRNPAWRVLSILERAARTVAAYLRAPRTVALALAIAAADNLAVVAVTALALLLIHPASVTGTLCLIVPMGEIVNSIPLTPGGLGVGETAFAALFNVAHLQGGAQALLYWRIWNVFASLLGLPFYLRGFRGRILDVRPCAPPGD